MKLMQAASKADWMANKVLAWGERAPRSKSTMVRLETRERSVKAPCDQRAGVELHWDFAVWFIGHFDVLLVEFKQWIQS
jgi:hypothetical protein